jgi:hypothetical protein
MTLLCGGGWSWPALSFSALGSFPGLAGNNVKVKSHTTNVN